MHLRQAEIDRYLSGQLSAMRGTALDMHVAECKECRERLKSASTAALLGVACPADAVTGVVRVLQPLSPMRLEARVVAKNEASMRLQIPEPIEPGALLQLQLPDSIVLAEARYCVQAMAQFLVGVRIRSVFPR